MILKKIRNLLAFAALGIHGMAQGQSTCTYSLGADVNICQGQTTTLTAPAGCTSYAWNTGPVTQSITVGAGNYSCTVVKPTGQLIVNGDFNAGNSGFSSQFNYNTDLIPEPNYFVDNNTVTHHNNFFATGNGNFLMANAGPNDNNRIVWQQTVPVCPGTTYTFSFSGCDISGTAPPTVRWYINGGPVSVPYTMPLGPGNWQNWSFTWTAPVGVFNAVFAVRVINPVSGGSDLGLDDISLSGSVTMTDAIQVFEHPYPVFDLGPSISTCINTPPTLNATVPGATYLWQDNSVNPTLVASTSGTYSVDVTLNNCTTHDAVNVTINPLPVMNCGGPYPLQCLNAPALQLNGTPAGGTWSGAGVVGTTFVPSAAGTGPHTLTYTYTDANNCSNSCTTNISVAGLPIVNCGSYAPRCVSAASFTLGGAPGGGTWSGPGVTGNSFDPATAGPGTHLVTYSYTNANGCTNTCSTSITVYDLPALGCGSYGPVCVDGASINLVGAPAGGTWSGAGVSAGSFNPGTAGAGAQTVTYAYTDAHGCANTCSTGITVNPLPVLNCGGYGPLCVNTPPITLNGTPVGGTWSGTGVSGNTFDPSVAGAGVHPVTYTYTDANGCSNSCTTNITISAIPIMNCGSYGPLCASGNPINLAGTPVGGTWTGPGIIGNTFDPTVAGPGVHTITYSYAFGNGCGNTCSTNITVNGPPAMNCGSYGPLCIDAAPIALAGSPVGGTWSGTGVAGNTFDPAVAGAGSHTITYTATDANGCSNSCTTSITVNALPGVNCGSYGPLCVNAAAIVLGGTPAGGMWSGAGVSGNSFDPAITGTGVHAVTYAFTDANGCSNSCTSSITVNALPAVNCGSYGPVCVNAAAIILGGTPVGGTWSGPGVSGTSFDPTTAGAGVHAVTYTFTDANGCSNSCTTNITVNALPVVNCGSYGPVCVNGASIALAGSPIGGTWSGVGVTGSAFDPAVAGAGAHTVTYTYTDANGCSNNCTTSITVNALPVVNCGSYGPLCVNAAAIALGGVPAGGTWSGTGVSGNTFDPSVAGVGVHAVTYTYTNGCSTSCTTNITVSALPVVNCGSYGPLCVNAAAITLGGTPVGGTWSGPGVSGTSFDPTIAGAGVHAVTYTFTDANGCSNSCTTNITVHALPVVNCGSYGPVCVNGTAINLVGNPAGGTWSGTGVSGATFDPSIAGAGTHTLTYTSSDANGCSNSCTTHITVNPLPVVDGGIYAALCANAAPIALAGSPSGGTWSGNGTSANTFDPAVTGPGAASITYSFTDANGCSSSDNATITVDPVPTVDLGNDTTVCPGAAVVFDATTPGATYLWQDASSSPTFTTAQPGIVHVQVTVNGCAARDTVVLNNFNLQSVDLGPDTIACAGQVVPLSVNVPGATYTWSTGSHANSVNVTTTGWYWVDAALNGCAVRDSIHATFNPLPSVNLGLDRMVCPGATALLNATTANATYLWNNNAVTPTINAGLGQWTVTVTVNGCSESDVVNVNNWTAPTVNLGPDTTLCPSQTLLLNATTPFMTYQWQDASQNSTFLVTQQGNYAVTLTDSHGCTGTDAVQVTYATPNPVFIGNDTTICSGTSIVLDGTTPGATAYSWNNGYQVPTLQVQGGGLYWLDVLQGNCLVTDSIHVTMAPLPTIDLGNDTTLCPNATLILDATTPGVSYQWQNGTQASTFLVNAAGTYSVLITDGNHCAGRDTIDVAYADPTAIELGPDTSICSGNTLTLDATLPGSTYQWNTSAVSPTIAVTSAGTYIVTVSQSGCAVVDSIHVSVKPTPTVDLGNDTTLCDGATLLLDATYPGATYQWTPGGNTATTTVSAAGNYSVTVTLDGCIASDAISVGYVGALAIDLGPDTTLCPGNTLSLAALLPGGTTVWSTNVVGASITVSSPAIYWANVTVSGCSTSDSITVDYVQLEPLYLGPDAAVCDGSTMAFDITVPGASYLWDDGSTEPTRWVGNAGTYWARVMLSGCSTSDTLNLSVVPLPVVDLGPDTGLCGGSTLLLDASVSGGSYLWNDGATSAARQVSSGDWSVRVTANGCSVTDSITVAALPTPTVSLPSDTTLCEGSIWMIDVAQPNATYLWQDGSVQSGYLVDHAGQYHVTVSIGPCAAGDGVNVQYFDASQVDLGPDTTLCPDQQLVLELQLPGVQLTWPDGTHGSSFTVTGPGLFAVQANANGCIANDTIAVDQVPLVQPDLGNDRIACEGDSLLLIVHPGAASVAWENGSISDTLLVTTTGDHTVTLQLEGCTSSDVVHIDFLPVIDSIDLGPDATICLGRTVELDATTAHAHYWWNSGSDDPMITVTVPGTYVVRLAGPCINATDTIVITEGNCAPGVFVPNGFTPNGDGYNDVFTPVVNGSLRYYVFRVFDRWGEAIFTSTTPNEAWDGRYDGTDAQDGVYVWTLDYKAVTDEGVKQDHLTGSVTLLR